MKNKAKLKYICIFFLNLFVEQALSSSSSVNQAQENLNHLQKKISIIKTNIKEKLTEHKKIKHKINLNVSKIELTEKRKNELFHTISHLNETISQTQKNIINIKNNLHTHQIILHQQLNVRLHLTQEPYWEIVFGAQNPFEYYQRLELAQYLNQSEQTKIQELKQSESNLKNNQISLENQQKILLELQKKLIYKEQLIKEENIVQQQKLHIIQQTIQENTQQLYLAEQNQEALKKLIQNLLKNNTLQTRKPLTITKQRMNLPITEHNSTAYEEAHGLVFVTPLNTAVHAVSPGKIVFADWLNGYGYLIIIDHGWGLMTLYGNNQTLIKHKGNIVKQGDIIAKTGQSGSFKKTGLYFEIRQRAKVVSARGWFKTHVA